MDPSLLKEASFIRSGKLKRIRHNIIAGALAVVSSASVLTGSYANISAKPNPIAQKAISRVGSRYQRGAAHSMKAVKNKKQRRFDCSGLVNWACYQSGHKIGLRTSSSLRTVGRKVSRKNMKSGDILLFPHHAGIYIGKGKMVHAPGRGRRISIVRLGSHWMRRCRAIRRV